MKTPFDHPMKLCCFDWIRKTKLKQIQYPNFEKEASKKILKNTQSNKNPQKLIFTLSLDQSSQETRAKSKHASKNLDQTKAIIFKEI